MRNGAEPKPGHSCGCSAPVRTGFRQSSCIAIPRPGAQSCKGVSGRLQRTSGNGCLSGLQQSPGDQMLFLLGAYPPILHRRWSKGKQYDYSQQGRESRTATGYSRLRTPFLIDQLAEEFPLDDFRLGLVLLPHSGSFYMNILRDATLPVYPLSQRILWIWGYVSLWIRSSMKSFS